MWQLLHSDEPTQNYHPTLLFPPALKGFSSSISSFSLFQRLTLLSWFMVLPRTTHQTDTFSNSLVNEAEYFLFVSVGLILLPTSSKKERNTCECLKTFYYTEFVKKKKKNYLSALITTAKVSKRSTRRAMHRARLQILSLQMSLQTFLKVVMSHLHGHRPQPRPQHRVGLQKHRQRWCVNMAVSA